MRCRRKDAPTERAALVPELHDFKACCHLYLWLNRERAQWKEMKTGSIGIWCGDHYWAYASPGEYIVHRGGPDFTVLTAELFREVYDVVQENECLA